MIKEILIQIQERTYEFENKSVGQIEMFYSKYEKMTKGSIQELKDILHAWQTLSTVAKS